MWVRREVQAVPSVSIVRLPGGSALQRSGAGAASILFLHGVAGGAWSWEPQVRALAQRFHLAVWEARGHGLANRVEDAGLSDYFADALEALDTVVACDGPAFVAGHSMGGLLAMALAAERPEAVRGLALIDPVYAPEGGRHGGGALASGARVLLRPLVRDLERNGPATRALGRWVFARAFEDRACRERAWRRQRAQVPVEYPKMMYEAFEGTTGFPNRAFAREFAMPALLVEPRSSAPRFPELLGDLAHLGDRFSYLALDGGHYLQLDRSAAQVTHALAEFVTRWSR
jgi:pimeloyl-ACP methyl ester carboxylesterase